MADAGGLGRLRDKVVTAAAKGIGRVTAELSAPEGAILPVDGGYVAQCELSAVSKILVARSPDGNEPHPEEAPSRRLRVLPSEARVRRLTAECL